MKPLTESGLYTAVAMGVRSLRAHRKLFAVLLLLTFAQAALQALLVWGLREVLLGLSLRQNGQSILIWSALVIFVLWSMRALATATGEAVAARIAYAVQTETMLQVVRKLVTLSVLFFERNSHGDLTLSANADLRGLRSIVVNLGTVILSLARLVALLAVAWMMSPKLALLGIVTVPLAAIPAYWVGARITRAARSERATAAEVSESFLQVATGIRLIRVHRGEDRIAASADSLGTALYQAGVRQAEAMSVARFLLEVGSGIGLIAVLIVGGREVGHGGLEWQSLLSLLIAVMAVYGPILSLLSVYSSLRTAVPSVERLRQILATPVEPPEAPNPLPLRHAPEVIRLENVSFSYGHRRVLDSVSGVFYRGETIGIVGPSGSGKSTLAALLLRFVDPTEGRVLYDGSDLRVLRHNDVMERWAIVLQEPFLFLDTVAANIRFARPSATMDEVIAAAKAANVHSEILEMRNGYETVLGNRKDADGVSVGQKQRICIAGALLKNAPLLLLDEATSNLDSVSERAVQTAIDHLVVGRTAFVVAHRLSTLRNADRILVLDAGRVAGLGTHTELLASCETYVRLWQAQRDGRSDPTESLGREVLERV
jgi:subfamily B ATP-binding cassette protein MsbA